jgi:TetR/AcrR family transcriptional regulator of autoinduction and epiphytic fitness
VAAPRPKLSDQKRAAILEAAAVTFRAEGFHATTMDTIAERAGVSKRTVYNHFSSKDELFDVITDGLWDKLRPARRSAPPATETNDVAARLRRLARERVDVLLDPEVLGLFRVLLGESVRSPELSRAYIGYREKSAFLGLKELFDDEVARGRLRIEQPELAAGQFWGLVLGPLFWPLVLGLRSVPEPDERDLVIDEAVAMFLARFRKASKPKKQGRRRS